VTTTVGGTGSGFGTTGFGGGGAGGSGGSGGSGGIHARHWTSQETIPAAPQFWPGKVSDPPGP